MKNLQVRIKTDLTTEPVTSTEAKLFCKVTGTAEDDLFTILIKSARQALEEYTQSSFGEKTIYATWVTMPEDYLFELPYGPIISVNKVYWIDEEGTEEEATLNSDYWVYGDQDAVVKLSTYWTAGLKATSTVRIEYTAGYGNAGTETLPSPLKQAILKQIATDYDMREDLGTSLTVLDNNSKKLASPYRKKLWF
jgi:uncharacterized phiE125 gp8 family phage protein